MTRRGAVQEGNRHARGGCGSTLTEWILCIIKSRLCRSAAEMFAVATNVRMLGHAH